MKTLCAVGARRLVRLRVPIGAESRVKPGNWQLGRRFLAQRLVERAAGGLDDDCALRVLVLVPMGRSAGHCRPGCLETECSVGATIWTMSWLSRWVEVVMLQRQG
jgi:hypothetical protein